MSEMKYQLILIFSPTSQERPTKTNIHLPMMIWNENDQRHSHHIFYIVGTIPSVLLILIHISFIMWRGGATYQLPTGGK